VVDPSFFERELSLVWADTWAFSADGALHWRICSKVSSGCLQQGHKLDDGSFVIFSRCLMSSV
jgi:hypothetical protein